MKSKLSQKAQYFSGTEKKLKRKLDPKIFDKAWGKAKREAKQLLGEADMEGYAHEIGGKKQISEFYKESEADPTGNKTTMLRENFYDTRRKY